MNIKKPISARLALVGIILVALALRPALVSTGPAINTIQKEFGMSHFAAGALISIPNLLMGLFALPTPWLAKKYGRDNLIIVALVMIAIATLGRAYSQNVAILLLCTAGIGTGIAISGALLSGFVKATFPTRTAFVMGIYAMSLSLGSTLSALITAPILKWSDSWRLATGIWSLPAIIGVIAWLIVAAKERRSPKPLNQNLKFNIPWRNKMAWRIALFFACVNLIFYALVAWTAPMYIEYGLSTNAAGYILGCFTFFFTLSTPLFGTLSKSFDRRIWLIASSQITLAGLILMFMFPGSLPFVFVAIIAIGLGGAFTLAMTLPLDFTGDPKETNAWTAFVLTVGYLIASIGPVLLGAIRDWTGNFNISVLMLASLSMGMILIAGTIKPKKSPIGYIYGR